MRCIVTAGPTWEPLDRVRRLTNFSTGSLGGDLANALAGAGHDVLLFLSETATWHSPIAAVKVEPFSTTDSLADHLRRHTTPDSIAIFHAAAVSDYRPGSVFLRGADDTLTPLTAGKVDSRAGSLLVELVATPKILPQLRNWFPYARITGWKYEVDGTAEDALDRGCRQLASARTDACVVNGPACGTGFTLLRRGLPVVPLDSRAQLIQTLVSGT